MSCALPQWKDPLLPVLFPGLIWKESSFVLDPQVFACCQATGLRWDPKAHLARSCRLQSRKRRLDYIVKRFAETWPEQMLTQELRPTERSFFLRYLMQFDTVPVHYGYLQSVQRDAGRPGPFWLQALLAVWRWGISTHVFTLGKSSDHDLIPTHIPANEYPLIYFLDGVNELWKPRYAEQVSAIINWCEQSQVPLWLEVRESAVQQTVVNSLDPKQAFNARLNKLKSKAPLAWLDEDCRSRLQKICRKSLFVS